MYKRQVHGSAPDIAGKNIANPSALLLAFALMLEDLGKLNEAKQLRQALASVVEEGKIVTPDIGGHASTTEFTPVSYTHLYNVLNQLHDCAF